MSKELHLTEGRGTGIPTILNALKENGSPLPIFDTNEPERTYFIVDIPIHEAFELELSDHVSDQVGDHASDHASDHVSDHASDHVSDHVSDQAISIIAFCSNAKSKQEILSFLGLKKHSINVKRHIQPLIEKGYLDYMIKDNLKDRNQKYVQTGKGSSLLWQQKNDQVSNQRKLKKKTKKND